MNGKYVIVPFTNEKYAELEKFSQDMAQSGNFDWYDESASRYRLPGMFKSKAKE